jgi:hypothetical protein
MKGIKPPHLLSCFLLFSPPQLGLLFFYVSVAFVSPLPVPFQTKLELQQGKRTRGGEDNRTRRGHTLESKIERRARKRVAAHLVIQAQEDYYRK